MSLSVKLRYPQPVTDPKIRNRKLIVSYEVLNKYNGSC